MCIRIINVIAAVAVAVAVAVATVAIVVEGEEGPAGTKTHEAKTGAEAEVGAGA